MDGHVRMLLTGFICMFRQPRDCTFETDDNAPNRRSHCPRYVTFPSYKPSGKSPVCLELLLQLTVIYGNRH
jgi:hypothetical protein